MSRRIRHIEANGNTYFTSERGVQKIATSSSGFVPAGLAQPLDITLALNNSSPVLMANNTAAAYRVLFGYRDANNNLIYSPPSARAVIENTAGGVRNVVITHGVPGYDFDGAMFVQVYRTTIVSNSVDPGDEMSLVYEAPLGGGSIVDITPDISRGAALYTNATQEGIENANNRPPLCTDIVEFRGMIGYANTTESHSADLQLIGLSGLTAATSTITIGGIVYTCQTTETAASGYFAKVTTGSPAQQIENTALSLCRVINSYSSNTDYDAFYVSTPDTLPGSILIRRRDFSSTALSFTANSAATGASFSPPIPTSGTTYSTSQDIRRNRIVWSKPGEPESVPASREIVVGSEDDEIQRVIALRDSVIVIKNSTVWRITGSVFEDLVAARLDDTTSCAGRDSYAKINNTIFGLSNQGFIAITDNGVQLVGRPEEHRVLAMLENRSAPNHDLFVATGVEAQRIYVCAAWDPELSRAISWVYNAITRSWSRWTINASCFAVANDRLLYGLSNAYGHVMQQRASRRDGDPHYRDFAEDSATFTISSIDTTLKTATGVLTNFVNYDNYNNGIDIGSKIYDGSNQYLVTAVSGTSPNFVVTLNTVESLTTSATTIYRCIPMLVGWQPRTAGNPGELKQFGDVVVKAETQNVQNVLVYAYNEIDKKTDPAGIYYDFATATTSTTVYVSPDGTAPSDTANDFALTIGKCVPNNTIRTAVPFDRQVGEHIEVRIYNDTAEARLAIKALVIDTRPLDSARGRQ